MGTFSLLTNTKYLPQGNRDIVYLPYIEETIKADEYYHSLGYEKKMAITGKEKNQRKASTPVLQEKFSVNVLWIATKKN